MTSARPLTLDARRASIRSCSRSSSARSSLSLVRPIRSQPIPTDFARSIPFKSRESSAGRAPLCACAVTTLPSLLGRYESSERASFPDKKTLMFISFHIPNSSLSLSLFLSLSVSEDVGYRSVEIASAFTHLPQKGKEREWITSRTLGGVRIGIENQARVARNNESQSLGFDLKRRNRFPLATLRSPSVSEEEYFGSFRTMLDDQTITAVD